MAIETLGGPVDRVVSIVNSEELASGSRGSLGRVERMTRSNFKTMTVLIGQRRERVPGGRGARRTGLGSAIA